MPAEIFILAPPQDDCYIHFFLVDDYFDKIWLKLFPSFSLPYTSQILNIYLHIFNNSYNISEYRMEQFEAPKIFVRLPLPNIPPEIQAEILPQKYSLMCSGLFNMYNVI